MKWNDTTSYSRRSRGSVEPRSWRLDGAPGTLCVHRWHGTEGWFVTCRELGLEKRDLDAEYIEDAKAEALKLVRERFNAFTELWGAALEEKP